jgi:Kef-type K+ transport system membrane component KefB
MDLAAWLVLAAALAGTGRAPRWPWAITLLLMIAFVAAMFLLVRPALGWWIRRPSALFANQVPVALCLAFGSAWVTAYLGLHPIFGGFLAGLVMPSRDGAQDPDVLRPMEQTADMLLPLFFVTTGLTFNIGSVDRHGLVLLAVILVVAVGGKLVPAYLASRISGLAPRQSALVGALVNTRGLTELIALNVGFAVGLIGQELFTVLVLMALITTFMTGPLLSLIGREETPRPAPARAQEAGDPENIPSA